MLPTCKECGHLFGNDETECTECGCKETKVSWA